MTGILTYVGGKLGGSVPTGKKSAHMMAGKKAHINAEGFTTVDLVAVKLLLDMT